MCPQFHQHFHQNHCHILFDRHLGSGGETDPARVGRMASMAADVRISLRVLINMMIIIAGVWVSLRVLINMIIR